MAKYKIERRALLKHMGILAAGGALAACTGQAAPAPAPAASAAPGTTKPPAPTPAAAAPAPSGK